MYPTIFAMGVKQVGNKTKIAGSLLVVTFSGGALLPLAMGYLSDHTNIAAAFSVPLICFVIIGVYAYTQKEVKLNK